MVLSLPCPDTVTRAPFLEPGLGPEHDSGRLVVRTFDHGVRTLAFAEASSRVVKLHLSDGEGAGAGVLG